MGPIWNLMYGTGLMVFGGCILGSSCDSLSQVRMLSGIVGTVLMPLGNSLPELVMCYASLGAGHSQTDVEVAYAAMIGSVTLVGTIGTGLTLLVAIASYGRRQKKNKRAEEAEHESERSLLLPGDECTTGLALPSDTMHRRSLVHVQVERRRPTISALARKGSGKVRRELHPAVGLLRVYSDVLVCLWLQLAYLLPAATVHHFVSGASQSWSFSVLQYTAAVVAVGVFIAYVHAQTKRSRAESAAAEAAAAAAVVDSEAQVSMISSTDSEPEGFTICVGPFELYTFPVFRGSAKSSGGEVFKDPQSEIIKFQHAAPQGGEHLFSLGAATSTLVSSPSPPPANDRSEAQVLEEQCLHSLALQQPLCLSSRKTQENGLAAAVMNVHVVDVDSNQKEDSHDDDHDDDDGEYWSGGCSSQGKPAAAEATVNGGESTADTARAVKDEDAEEPPPDGSDVSIVDAACVSGRIAPSAIGPNAVVVGDFEPAVIKAPAERPQSADRRKGSFSAAVVDEDKKGEDDINDDAGKNLGSHSERSGDPVGCYPFSFAPETTGRGSFTATGTGAADEVPSSATKTPRENAQVVASVHAASQTGIMAVAHSIDVQRSSSFKRKEKEKALLSSVEKLHLCWGILCMAIGSGICFAAGDPLAESMREVAEAVGLSAFAVTFVAAALATNAPDLILAALCVMTPTEGGLSTAIGCLMGGMVVNYTLCLALLLFIAAQRNLLVWFPADTLAIVACNVIVLFVLARKVLRRRHAFTLLALYPASVLGTICLQRLIAGPIID